MGTEGLNAVIEHLPTQYSKRSLDSPPARAAYVRSMLESPQRPFIWEYFRPGTIEIPRGEGNYYDEVKLLHPLSITPPTTSFLETPWRIPVHSSPPCIFSLLFVARCSAPIPP